MNDVSTLGDDQALEERLADFAADLLARKKYQGIVQKLFAVAKGTWISVQVLCADYPKTDALWDDLGRFEEEDLQAAWLDYPGTPEDTDQAFIVFFSPVSYWSKAAFYNRNTLPAPTGAPLES
jgi:hypothetical protein